MPNFQKRTYKFFFYGFQIQRNICQIVHKYHQTVHKFTNRQESREEQEERKINNSTTATPT
jgi:hypothetical protein